MSRASSDTSSRDSERRFATVIFADISGFTEMSEKMDPEDVAASADYGGPFPAAIQRGNVWGCQFHPEKSSDAGRTLLSNFLAREIE